MRLPIKPKTPAARPLAARLLLLFGTVLAVICFGGVPAVSAQSVEHPNILFVSIDDLNDWVGALGGFDDVIADPKIRSLATPNLDRLAQLGVTFTNANTAASACNPSRSSLLTGIAPATSGLTNNPPTHFRSFAPLRFATTLPQHLKKPGGGRTLYTVKTTGKVFHTSITDLPGESPSPGGFTEWDAAPTLRTRRLPKGLEMDGWRTEPNPWRLRSLTWEKQIPTYRGRDVTDPELLQRFSDLQADQQRATWGAREIREDPPGGAPKLIAVGIYRPHLPWSVPVQFFDRFPLDTISVPRIDPDGLLDLDPESLRMGATSIHPVVLAHGTDPDFPGETDLAWRLAIQAYLASVAYADDAVGKLLEAVEEKNGDDDPTNDWTVVLWSDHGWHLGEKERWKKFTLWEESVRSVLMVWKPGLTRPGTVVDIPVDFLDLFPTVVDLAGLEPPMHLQGYSFRDLLVDPVARLDNFAFSTYIDSRHSARSLRWRYIRYDEGREELYDHFNDPDEFFNLLHAMNRDRLADFGLTGGRVEQVRRAHSTALFEWSIKVHNQSIYDGDLSLETVDTLGERRIERFQDPGELSTRGWDLLSGGGADGAQDVLIADGAGRAAAGPRVHSTIDGIARRAGEDFLTSVAVTLAGDTTGLGLLFGHVDRDDYYEFLLVNESSPHADGATDVVLRRQEGGVEETLLRFEDMGRPERPGGPPLDFRQGAYKLVASYRDRDQLLELIVQDGLGVNLFRRLVPLAEPLPIEGGFGIASWEAGGGGSFDDYVALSYPPVQTFGTRLDLESPNFSVEEGAGSAVITVRRAGDGVGAISLSYRAEAGTAWSGLDYQPVTGTLVWGAGDLSEKSFEVPIVADELVEGDEVLTLHLSPPTGAGRLGRSQATLTLVDDDLPASKCQPTAETVCLNRGRFAVRAQWRTAEGVAGHCGARQLSDDSGYCWFFQPDNVELVFKVLDACASARERYWVLAAGLTDVEVAITVVDTGAGIVRRYASPAGSPFAPLQDTDAFPTCP